jgi:hypothetical protein
MWIVDVALDSPIDQKSQFAVDHDRFSGIFYFEVGSMSNWVNLAVMFRHLSMVSMDVFTNRVIT